MKHTHLLPLLAVVALLFSAGCGDAPLGASETRVVMPASAAGSVEATSEQRFGMAAPMQQPAAAPETPGLAWDAPEGWRDAGSQGLRLANFRVGPNGEGECYLTVLGGTGGGVELNVNRWRSQMGLAEASAEEIASLSKAPMLGGEAVLVDVAGNFGGMQDEVHTTAASAQADYALLGAILVRESESVFLKMTGPADVVRGERGNFLKFTGSVRETSAPSGACPGHATAGESSCPSEAHACPSTASASPSE